MDRPTKTAIKKLVLGLRKLLEEDIEVVLKRYGLFTDRAWLPLDKIPKADEPILAARRRMEAAIAVEQARDLKPGEATRWYIREVAFTYLNRLVGLKCLEVRGLIEEVITTRTEYGGRSIFHRDFRQAQPDLAAQPDDALPAMLEAACRHVTDAMIGVLFDPASESSVIWPRYQTLRQAIGLINDLPAEVWAEDEIIGWVYQFYNAEEKERIRDRGKPQLPIEVAVINQFFTPRWVVKFLVDNTLGRLWLEMHPDSARVRGKCDYLVPEPLAGEQGSRGAGEKKGTEGTEGNLGDGQDPTSSNEFLLDPNSPINNATALPRRPAKPVTEIRLIDPACGGMHFGYYAFEVFQEMYRDARERSWPVWGDEEARTRGGAKEQSPISNLQSPISNLQSPTDEEIPALILRHNLYGVDIDLRAIQLAALALYMKARTAQLAAIRQQSALSDHHSQFTIQSRRPPVGNSQFTVNLVCADARLTNGPVRARFLKEYEDDPALQKVWRELFREMEDIGQVGSLLRVEERFRQLLQEYNPASVTFDRDHQMGLPNLAQPARQLGFGDVRGATTWTPRRTLADMLAHLRDFARHALEEADINAQLFAVEAEKTLSLLDIFLQDYDVVVTNPPFGPPLSEIQNSLREIYPNSYRSLVSAFLDRAKLLTKNNSGLVGAIVDKSCTLRSTYENFREWVLIRDNSLRTMLDLGWGVLDDANVETVVLILGPNPQSNKVITPFFRITTPEPEYKSNKLELLMKEFKQERQSSDLFLIDIAEFMTFPNKALSYWGPGSIRKLFRKYPALDPSTATVTDGIKPADADTFIKYWWEVPFDFIGGRDKKWVLVSNGGYYSPFYRTITQVVLYEDNGKAIKSHRNAKGQKSSRTTAEEFYFQSGITYGKRTKIISFQRLETNQLFTNEGHAMFPHNSVDTWHLIAILNSPVLQLATNTLCGQHKDAGYIRQLPYTPPSEIERLTLEKWAHFGYDIKVAWDTGNEICTYFTTPWLLQLANTDGEAFETGLREVVKLLGWKGLAYPITLEAMLAELEEIEQAADARLQQLQARIDETVYELYEISPADRALIERELGERPPELVWPQMEGKAKAEKRREHVRRLLSYFVLQALKADADGIVPLVEGAGQSTVLDRLREGLEGAFTQEIAFKLEDEARHILGKTLEVWLEREFSQWHAKLYKNRPILWHLASPQGTFSVLVYYHKLDRDTLRKVRNVYLWTLRDGLQKQLVRARDAQDNKTIDRLETALDDLTVFDERLGRVIEAGYAPVIDDGVKVNILPLQEAGVLKGKVV